MNTQLEYLRGQLRAGCISYDELLELQSMKHLIDPGDVELLQAAGVPEDVAMRRQRILRRIRQVPSISPYEADPC